MFSSSISVVDLRPFLMYICTLRSWSEGRERGVGRGEGDRGRGSDCYPERERTENDTV